MLPGFPTCELANRVTVNSLSDTIRDFKQYTAKRGQDRLKQDGKFDLLEELKIAANKDKDRNTKIWRRIRELF